MCLQQGVWTGPTEEEAGLRPLEQSLQEADMRKEEPGSQESLTQHQHLGKDQGIPACPVMHPTRLIARSQDNPYHQPSRQPPEQGSGLGPATSMGV